MARKVKLYTVGHSQRSLEELIGLLAEAGIRCLVDVRRYPTSKRFPHFASDRLRAACVAAAITYHWAGERLGGYRPTTVDSPHTALADGLRGYADYMESEPFARNIAQLKKLAESAPTTILCAEKRPQDCHRLLISDFLWSQGVAIEHLIDPGVRETHQLSSCARLTQGKLIYDRLSQQTLAFDA